MGFVRVLVVLLALVLVPLAGAQSTSDPAAPVDNTVTIGDGAADVEIYVANRAGGPKANASQTGGGSFDHLDVLKIVFGEETDDDFKVSLQMKTLTSTMPSWAGQRFVFFAYGKVNWRLSAGGCERGAPGSTPAANLGCVRGNGGGQGSAKSVPLEIKASENTWVFTVPKAFIFNENRVPARFGDSLTNISASGLQSMAGLPGQGGQGGGGGWDPTGGVYAYDRAPNDGFGPAFTFQKGSNGRGYIGLSSLDPIRVSNGEATTIVYKVKLNNQHTEPVSVELSSIVPPQFVKDGWTVRVPALLRMEPKSSLTFPVILALPFTHNHGTTALFQVRAQAVEDPNSFSELDLGVFWTEVPQPSAHHETEDGGTFFHSAYSEDDFPPEPVRSTLFPVQRLWMNGIDEDPDPDAKDANVPAFFNDGFGCVFNRFQGCGIPPQMRASWHIPLDPGLLLGLDFDLSRTGMMTMDIIPKVPSQNAQVIVNLQYCDPTQQGSRGGGGGGGGGFGNQTCFNYGTLLASGRVTQPLSVNVPNHFEIPLAIEQVADFIPYRRGHNIRLEILLLSETPQNALFTEPRPEFVTNKARLQLPLIEYHDPIDQAFENVGVLSLESRSPFEKQVNPGKTTVFGFDLKNTGKVKQPIRLELSGVHAEWARLAVEPQFELAPGEVRNITVAVLAPDDAQPEERAELFFVAQNEQDASVVAVTRMRATVVLDPEIPDEADLAGTVKEADTPGFEAALLVAAVGGLVALGRRRRQP